MFLPGDRIQIYYNDWLLKLYPQSFRHPKIGGYHKVWIEVLRIYLDTIGDYAYVCKRCDCKNVDRHEFVIRMSELMLEKDSNDK
jgi:hypothetical protein